MKVLSEQENIGYNGVGKMMLLTSIANYFVEFEIYLGGLYGSTN